MVGWGEQGSSVVPVQEAGCKKYNLSNLALSPVCEITLIQGSESKE